MGSLCFLSTWGTREVGKDEAGLPEGSQAGILRRRDSAGGWGEWGREGKTGRGEPDGLTNSGILWT